MPSNTPVICLSCAIWNAFSIPFDIPRIYFWYVIYLTLKIPLVNHEDTFNTYTLNATSYTFSIPFNKTWEYLGLFIPFIYLSYPMIFLLKYFDICIYIYFFTMSCTCSIQFHIPWTCLWCFAFTFNIPFSDCMWLWKLFHY